MASKAEIKDFVQEVYAAYNENIFYTENVLVVDEKVTYRSWYNLLFDIEIQHIRSAFRKLSSYSRIMPRPVDIRRSAIDISLGSEPQLDQHTAWVVFLNVMINSNARRPTEIGHPKDVCLALVETIRRLGHAARIVFESRDKNTFIAVYSRVIWEIESVRYSMPNAGTTSGRTRR